MIWTFSLKKVIHDSYEKSAYHQEVLNEIHDIELKYNQFNSSTSKYDKYKSTSSKSYTTTYFIQFLWLIWRQIKNTLREPLATRIIILQSILIGFFLGFTYFQLKTDQSSVQNKNGLLFMILMQTCLAYLFSTASVSLYKYFFEPFFNVFICIHFLFIINKAIPRTMVHYISRSKKSDLFHTDVLYC
jgi:hypothetical protein